ncbi:MAG: hypothetical protein WAT79_04600 [Saprospiraceae bacterium]
MLRTRYSSTLFLPLIILMGGWFSCAPAPDLDIIPEISNISLSKNFMNQGSFNMDSIIFKIEFTDGDGNFGSKNVSNVFIKDSRKSTLIYEFKAPEVPEQGTKNGIRGVLYVTMYSLCCFTDQNPSCCLDNFGCPQSNNFHFEVYIRDRDGQDSNTFTTSDIDLWCI